MVCRREDEDGREDVERARAGIKAVVAGFRDNADLHANWTEDHRRIVAIAERWAAMGDVHDVAHASLLLKIMVPIVKGQPCLTKIYKDAVDVAERVATMHLEIFHHE
jgi:hypothetical protein